MRAADTKTTSKPRRHASWPSAWAEVGFAHAGGALNQHGFVALDEAARGEVEDVLPIDRGIAAKVEAFQRLREVDRGAANRDAAQCFR